MQNGLTEEKIFRQRAEKRKRKTIDKTMLHLVGQTN